MGAPKQKWTAEEEAALKAGVLKHGAGKWRTILKDPEFSGVLYLRSNVDLKDKWRNMSVMVNGWNSREKTRLPVKRVSHVTRLEDSSASIRTVAQSDEEAADAKDLAISADVVHIDGPKRSIVRLDNLILEAITALKEPGGSNRTTIASFIEEQYWAPPNFERLLSAKLKHLASVGKLVKVKRKYSIPPAPGFMDRRRATPMLLSDRQQKYPPKVEEEDIDMLTREQIDLELAKMRTMTPREAAAAAARAVAEAEAAIAAAEEAAREAEAAEADAAAAQAFAEAAMKTLKGRNPPKMMIRA
ncbi:telomere repeat-binding factor 1 [Punica granatum]|uniref:Telomere repeat-binding factor 1 n=2 Tax=Punica granatum TaxID=22663 RepID=A0A6P8CIQ0_PUNGR|nr:telomere repeat-binding factor 1 [Punica granatum]PKI71386.1 hypothetical protein CRG98_008245 [Punica granatum]